MTLKKLAAHIAAEFEKHYGRPPRWIVAAPGRVNVIGEHTDYNDGFVLPMAIERYAIMAADAPASPTPVISVYDTHFKETAKIDTALPVVKGAPKWSNYIRGVLAGFQNRGEKIPALDVAFMSTVPLGGGLSSSAALEVCTATLIEAATGRPID
ncbi:MAG TPA: galactokinase family protein, partial [Candidatus Binatia bacterium]|nr:galactokinase family protein [Candidatus Binatia bacterium]